MKPALKNAVPIDSFEINITNLPLDKFQKWNLKSRQQIYKNALFLRAVSYFSTFVKATVANWRSNARFHSSTELLTICIGDCRIEQ